MEAGAQTRRKIFTRDPDYPFRLEERDRDILAFVGERRYADSEHVEKFFGISRKAATRRLNGLFHHGYVDRPRYQLTLGIRKGSLPRQVNLTAKGAREVEESRGFRVPHGETAEQSYKHFLGVSSIYAHVAAMARAADVEVLWDRDILARSRPGADPTGWKLSVEFNGKYYENLGLKHDGMFALRKDGKERLFLLEFDRGTEQFRVDDLYKSTIAKKLVLYRESVLRWKNGSPHPYGIEYPQVVFIVDSPNAGVRVRGIQERASAFDIAQDTPNLFRFATLEDLLGGGIRELLWTNLRGSRVALLPKEELCSAAAKEGRLY